MIQKMNGPCFEISFELVPFDLKSDEKRPCWHALIGDSVVAKDFPVQERGSNDVGLQIPVEVMAALGGASIAVQIRPSFSTYVIMGQSCAFIATEERESSIQWHFVDGGGEPVTYEYLTEKGFASTSCNMLDDNKINTKTAFLGWTTQVLNFAGMFAVTHEAWILQRHNRNFQVLKA